jgi:hypothetical protein
LSKKIRITVTKVLEYEPKLDIINDYLENDIMTVEQAMELDKKMHEDNEYSLWEIVQSNSGREKSVNVAWEIVND